VIFYLRDQQISKEYKDWLYPQLIENLKKVTDLSSYVSPITLPQLANY
jgi:hypothetical protein